jgi:hypothetical protein
MTAMGEATAERHSTAFQHLAAQAHAFAYQKDGSELADYLRRTLGRPLTARLTATADMKTITRWANGSASPEPLRKKKMRVATEIHYILTHLFGSEESAADWFTGNNPLFTELPADLIRVERFQAVYNAVRAVSEVIEH